MTVGKTGGHFYMRKNRENAGNFYFEITKHINDIRRELWTSFWATGFALKK